MTRSAVGRLLPRDSIRRRLASGVAWSFVSTGVQQAMLLVIGIALAQLLGPARFGAWGIVYSTISTLGVFIGLGMAMTATKYVAELRGTDPYRAWQITRMLHRTVWLFGIPVALALILAAPALSGPLLQAPELEFELRLASLTLVSITLFSLEQGSLAGFEAFRRLALVNAVRAALGVVLTVGAGALLGLSGAVGGLAVATIIGWLIARRAVADEWARIGVGSRNDGAVWRDRRLLLTFTLPAVAASSVVAPPMWIGNIYLATQAGFAELGGFVAANQWRFVVTFFPNVMAVALLPILSSLIGQRSPRARPVIAASIVVSAVGAAPIVLVLVLFNSQVMLLHGVEFQRFAPVLTIVALTGLLYAAQSPVGQLVAASGHMWLGAGMNVAWSVLFLVATWRLVGDGAGAVGLALAYLVAYAASSVWTFGYAFWPRGAPSRSA